jgi:hypothetical protein
MKIRNRVGLRVEELEGRTVPSTLAYSYNWSGYALSTGAGAVSQVAGSWVVPAVSSSVSGYSAAWVGIDGWSNNMVEQIGTQSNYLSGQARYSAWYEMYPAPAVNLGLTITPGDTISAAVVYNGSGQFLLSITDVNTGGMFSTTQTSSGAVRTSAEWVQEAPSSIAGTLPLADFGTINFSGASATVNGTSGPADNSWSGTTLYQANMINARGALKATTSALTDSGTPATSSFSVTWVSSGANTKGNGRKAPMASSPALPQITFPLQSSPAGAAAPQGALPSFIAMPSVNGSAAPAQVVASPALTVSAAATTAFAPFALDSASLPSASPRDEGDAPDTRPSATDAGVGPNDGATPFAKLDAALSSGSAPGEGSSQPATSSLPATSSDSMFSAGSDSGSVALAGLVLVLPVGRGSAIDHHAEHSDRARSRRRHRA